jgi:hypothetical protein
VKPPPGGFFLPAGFSLRDAKKVFLASKVFLAYSCLNHETSREGEQQMDATAPAATQAHAPTAVTVEQILDFARDSLKFSLDNVRAYEQRCREGQLDGDKAAVLIEGIADLGLQNSVIGNLLFAAGAYQESQSVGQGMKHLREVASQAAFQCRMSCIGRASWQQQAA